MYCHFICNKNISQPFLSKIKNTEETSLVKIHLIKPALQNIVQNLFRVVTAGSDSFLIQNGSAKYIHTKRVPRCYGRKRISKCSLMNSAPVMSHVFCRILPILILQVQARKTSHDARPRLPVAPRRSSYAV